MPRSSDEQAHTAHLDRQYRDRQSEVFLEIEREILGCDYGATSWTDREEAERVADLLHLGSRMRALELGAGSGWPGLYLARRFGSEAMLIDLPRDGLRIASTRAARDGLADRCGMVAADGAALPFHNAEFDAIYHCDVLC